MRRDSHVVLQSYIGSSDLEIGVPLSRMTLVKNVKEHFMANIQKLKSKFFSGYKRQIVYIL